MCSNAETNQIGKLLFSREIMMLKKKKKKKKMMAVTTTTTTVTVGYIINIFVIYDDIKENKMSEACNMRDNKCIGLHDFGWNT
jgi:hypothetical protein